MFCNESNLFIAKVEIRGEPIYTKVKWKPGGGNLFDMQLINNNSSWSGQFTLEAAKMYRDLVEEDENVYNQNVLKYLQNNSSQNIFDFIPNTNSAQFIWKKKFEGSTAVMVHGKVSLLRDEKTETKNTLIDILLDKNFMLMKSIEDLKAENNKLYTDFDKCKKELENFAEMKISLESTLYSKFLQLLNAKKKRIQLLEDMLQEHETS